ncbi:MAG: hypothetical protein ACF8AM_04130, partial [Rhodopirellula sp. JB055]|uniref:hypothetical protein n=1 Tax=Rhodopirellula sp. JB055 TaxID=3342846 RepID=UPI00370B9CF0
MIGMAWGQWQSRSNIVFPEADLSFEHHANVDVGIAEVVCSFDRSCVWDRTYKALDGASFSV